MAGLAISFAVGKVSLIHLAVVLLSGDILSSWAMRVKPLSLHGEPLKTSRGDVKRSPRLLARSLGTASKEVNLLPSVSPVGPADATNLTPAGSHLSVVAEAAPPASHKIPNAHTHSSPRASSLLETGAMAQTVRGRLSSFSVSFAAMAKRAAIGAQQEARLVATSARQKALSWTETISEKPAETVTIALAMLVTICIVSQVVSSSEETLLKMKVSDQRNAMESSIDELLTDMESIVAKIIESSAYLAEQNFDGKRRDFVSNLRQASEAGGLQSPGLTKPFRRFVEQWLNAFAECSLEPIESPIQVVSKEELDECKDAAQIARLLVDRLERTRVNFLSKLDELLGQEGAESLPALAGAERGRSRMRTQPNTSAGASLLTQLGQRKRVWSSWSSWFAVGRGLGFSFGRATPESERTSDSVPFVIACCWLKLSVLSLKHALLLAVPWCCTGSFAWNCLRRSVPFAAIAFAALAGSVVLLLRFRDHAGHVDSQIEQLHQAKDAAKTRRDEVEQLYGRLENVTSLWLNRTVPHLDILTEVHEESRDISAERLVEFFETSNAMLEKVRLALGPLEIWCGAKMLHEQQLVAVAGQLTDSNGSYTIKKNAPRSKRTIHLGQKKTVDLHAKLEGWDEKQNAKQCGSCNRNFSLLVRRHRCRACGGVVCRSCSSQTRPVPKLGFLDAVRVCDMCVKRLDLEAIEDAEKLMTRAAMPDLLSKVTLLSFLSVTVDEMLSTSSGELGDFSRTYLRLRVADSTWVRSDALKPNAPPTWKADFFFPVRKNDKVLMIELLRDSLGWSDEVLGSADIRFRDLNINERHSLKINLGDGPVAPKCTSGVRPHGVLALSLQLAADAWHLNDY